MHGALRGESGRGAFGARRGARVRHLANEDLAEDAEEESILAGDDDLVVTSRGDRSVGAARRRGENGRGEKETGELLH